MAYCVFRYRHQEGRRAAYEPENKKLEWWLTGLTTVGVAGMLAPGLFVWDQFVTVPKDAAEFEVLGRSEEHTSELQSLMRITYDVLCLKKKKMQQREHKN